MRELALLILSDSIAGLSGRRYVNKPCLRMLPGQKTWEQHGRPNIIDVPDSLRILTPALLTPGKTKEEALDILSKAVGLSQDNPTRIIESPVERVILRRDLLAHVVEDRMSTRERFGDFLIPTLTAPYEVWITEYPDGFRTHYIGLFQGSRDMFAVARMNRDGSLIWNLLRARVGTLNRARAGEPIYKK
ncbi:MAG: hypothetical protein HQL63_00750 [Magnetococcales bacterium]|nr:hypothetical protein [Magnetococcales bacterium]